MQVTLLIAEDATWHAGSLDYLYRTILHSTTLAINHNQNWTVHKHIMTLLHTFQITLTFKIITTVIDEGGMV